MLYSTKCAYNSICNLEYAHIGPSNGINKQVQVRSHTLNVHV